MPNPIEEITKAMAGFRVIADQAQSMPQAPEYYVRFFRAWLLKAVLEYVARLPVPEAYLSQMARNGYAQEEATALYRYALQSALKEEQPPVAEAPTAPQKAIS